VQCEPRIAAQIRALARVRHRPEGELAVLEGRLDPGDPRRPVGSQGGNRLVPVPVEKLPHAPRELRFRALDVPPRRHAPNIAQATEGELAGMSCAVTIRFTPWYASPKAPGSYRTRSARIASRQCLSAGSA
jgi:hypothetical protein